MIYSIRRLCLIIEYINFLLQPNTIEVEVFSSIFLHVLKSDQLKH